MRTFVLQFLATAAPCVAQQPLPCAVRPFGAAAVQSNPVDIHYRREPLLYALTQLIGQSHS
jgi:hypothetical protein